MEELVVVRVVTVVRKPSSKSHSVRRSHRGDIPSTSGGGYRDVGLDENSPSRGFGGSPVAVAALEENPVEDTEEDSLGIDGFVLEAIERLIAQNVQQQRQPQQSTGINVVVKQFQDLHPLEFDGSLNPLVFPSYFGFCVSAIDCKDHDGGRKGKDQLRSAKKQWKRGLPQKRKFDGKPWSSSNRGDNSNKKFKAGENRLAFHSVTSVEGSILENAGEDCYMYNCGKPSHIRKNCPEAVRT
ncbi:hypothetical protein FNV43_RR07458 [Rhamnella rubrinervis]|uniref:CCHC-type domain-containing protein n=1 Tax=Rhamnella rubrinervis TaxID=2594499 RepID=A0A8K0HGP0_9ROSA|nr:hypothetical protein FNV43_RR07458 [Rhamnella rubrinervis]